jgi:lipopolysaccharide/colanic/teichoic acid biosynthesis glycosyltransferase
MMIPVKPTFRAIPTPDGPYALARLRYQLFLGLLASVVLPGLLYHFDSLSTIIAEPSSYSTLIGAFVATSLSLYLYRRVITFPGVGLMSYVMPAVAAGYGLVLAVFFALRLDYSRLLYSLSFGAALIFFFAVSSVLRRRLSSRFYVVPFGSACDLRNIPEVEWIMLTRPQMPAEPGSVLIADLRADLGDEWERLIAQAAVSGRPVYHVKQVLESLSGRVEIEHLSENSFGSLIPNLNYRKIKRLLDLIAAVIALPILFLPGLFVALAIKLESAGPVFFRQERLGYRGKPFHVVKFRTMRHDIADAGEPAARDTAITVENDPRITRLGQLLRRTRIDELPQIWNILAGDMSWIGPRPEAMALSAWYMSELPFYSYRHIVRPGITGWAQVNQGHVADLDSVTHKLHYDFYYIKNFSAWLDLLILAKTVTTVFTGHGAR